MLNLHYGEELNDYCSGQTRVVSQRDTPRQFDKTPTCRTTQIQKVTFRDE